MGQVDVKLFEIIPNLHILQYKGEITFNNNNKWKSLWLLNFHRVAILDFYEVLRLPLLFASFQYYYIFLPWPIKFRILASFQTIQRQLVVRVEVSFKGCTIEAKSLITFRFLVESTSLRSPVLVMTRRCYNGWIWYLTIFHSQGRSTFYFGNFEACWCKTKEKSEAKYVLWHIIDFIDFHGWLNYDGYKPLFYSRILTSGF